MRSVTKIGGDTYLVCERALGLIPSTAKKQKVNLPEVGARLGLASSLNVCLWLVSFLRRGGTGTGVTASLEELPPLSLAFSSR